MMSKECSYCHFKEPMPFTCKLCGDLFCYDHRLPESHNCPGLIRLKERNRENVRYHLHDHGIISKKEMQSPFRPVFKALSVLGSNCSLAILAVAIVSFFLEWIIGFMYFSYFALFPLDYYSYPLKLAVNLITHIFLHSGGFHLLFHMLFLYIIGPELERRIGGRKFLTVFFISGIAGGLGYVLWSFINYYLFHLPPSPAVGASGALLGVFACLAIMAPEIRVYVFFIPVPMKLTQALVFFTLLDIIFIVMGDPVALSAHLSGAAAGFLMGGWIKRKEGKLSHISTR